MVMRGARKDSRFPFLFQLPFAVLTISWFAFFLFLVILDKAVESRKVKTGVGFRSFPQIVGLLASTLGMIAFHH
jgi:hypothetical protein